MKLLSAISLILGAGIAISQASAAPLRVVLVGEHIKGSTGFIRIGHAAATNNGVSHPHPNIATVHSVNGVHVRPKHGCAGSLRNKAMQFSNWFRITFHTRPAANTPNHNILAPVRVTPTFQPTYHPVGHAHAHQHTGRPYTFVQRLTHALMMLGPWEGRAVAFILGCGIGVLIRMFWVLTVLAIRSFRGKRQREEFIEDEVLFEEEEHLLAPPQYVDEYIVMAEEKEGKEPPRNA